MNKKKEPTEIAFVTHRKFFKGEPVIITSEDDAHVGSKCPECRNRMIIAEDISADVKLIGQLSEDGSGDWTVDMCQCMSCWMIWRLFSNSDGERILLYEKGQMRIETA
jgi:hypothetical protein